MDTTTQAQCSVEKALDDVSSYVERPGKDWVRVMSEAFAKGVMNSHEYCLVAFLEQAIDCYNAGIATLEDCSWTLQQWIVEHMVCRMR